MADVIHELLLTDAAIGKLGARGHLRSRGRTAPRNRHVTVRIRTNRSAHRPDGSWSVT